MDDQPLSSIGKNQDEGEEFLLEIISDVSKFGCLNSFSECIDLVHWVKSVTEDSGKCWSSHTIKHVFNFCAISVI